MVRTGLVTTSALLVSLPAPSTRVLLEKRHAGAAQSLGVTPLTAMMARFIAIIDAAAADGFR